MDNSKEVISNASEMSSFDARITGAETNIKSLEHIVGDLARNTAEGFSKTDAQIIRSGERVEQQISELMKIQNQSARTNWSPILATIAVLVSIFGLAGGAGFTILALSGRAMVEPLNVSIANLHERASDNRLALKEVETHGTPWVIAKFIEVETQFKWMEKWITEKNIAIIQRLDNYDSTRINWPTDLARHDERIKILEDRIKQK